MTPNKLNLMFTTAAICRFLQFNTNLTTMRFVLLLTATASLASAFAPNHVPLRPIIDARLHAAELGGVDPALVGEARTAFFIWFFGASGGAGIARSAFPRMFKNVMEVNALKGVGPSKGGEKLSISPLCGYPQAIYKADVEQIINQKISVAKIVEKYPVEGNFLSKRGYLTYEAFKRANKDANPLTLRVVFDSLSTGSDVASPDKAQEILDSYKTDLNALATNVLQSKLKGYLAIFTLLFLLALADYEALVVHFRSGTLTGPRPL
jgi:hypothetical protein